MSEKFKRVAKQVEEEVVSPVESDGIEVRWDRGVVSTGSTLLDLAISGGRVRGGGIPGGLIVEIFGPSGFGKTALLMEICSSAQARGGDIFVADPEARLDKEYSRIYGVHINQDKYSRPNTVTEMFEHIKEWKPERKKERTVCVYGGDSLAALSTQMELEDSDQYGMRRAKEFSESMRKVCRLIANENWLLVLTNQEREGPSGVSTPGGRAIGYYSSLRIRVASGYPSWKIKKKVKVEGKDVEQIVGIKSQCTIKKSSVDNPYREADVSIIFQYGIDDLRGNLQYCKDMTGGTKYACQDKEYQGIDKAIGYIESNGQAEWLRERTISLWEEVQERFKIQRMEKVRK